MLLPNLFLAGCQKSGSTSLAEYIAAHPACSLSTPKENAFFSRATNLQDLPRYERAFLPGADPNARYVIDATTENMANPRAAHFIVGALGAGLKAIFMLRAPTARAYSGFLHLYKRGHERRDPEEVLLGLGEDPIRAEHLEQARLARALVEHRITPEPYQRRYDDYLWSFRYVANTYYRRQIAEYETAFGRDNVLVLIMERAIRTPDVLRKRLSDFLDIDPSGFPAGLPHENKTRIPQQPSLRSRIARIVKGRPNAVDVVPVSTRPSPRIVEALYPLFHDERTYWSEQLGVNLADFGW